MNESNPVHSNENRVLISQNIRSLSDETLQSLTAHADFYRHELNLPPEADSRLLYHVLSSICRREQQPRPEDLSSPMAFKFYLKRLLRSYIDSCREPERVPFELQATNPAMRRERKQFRCRLYAACRQLGTARHDPSADPKIGRGDDFSELLHSECPPASSHESTIQDQKCAKRISDYESNNIKHSLWETLPERHGSRGRFDPTPTRPSPRHRQTTIGTTEPIRLCPSDAGAK